ncbi:hypothetical protein ArV1_043 [Arthrobacter phage vB_ArtM-ArV1]|uniref:Uncharacterized protein n=1 Tax=Arthrobacter phage vB_ArtM-ArV1 TaxID=1566993 RepID=A0A0A7HBU1_9CAUD|nr:hypothetical protein ArV1_043 [Arthrobacter phage vB_ArtM-ArV1]AIZ01731.1 hypothetical protein ArV1_043 [Arthrobacter phage vB_ArtM-ArV1]
MAGRERHPLPGGPPRQMPHMRRGPRQRLPRPLERRNGHTPPRPHQRSRGSPTNQPTGKDMPLLHGKPGHAVRRPKWPNHCRFPRIPRGIRMTTGMTNNQAALLAATTANANRLVTNREIVQATMSFKELLDTLDKQDATTQAEAEKAEDYQALPAYCQPHLKEVYADFWGQGVPKARALQPGEHCTGNPFSPTQCENSPAPQPNEEGTNQ